MDYKKCIIFVFIVSLNHRGEDSSFRPSVYSIIFLSWRISVFHLFCQNLNEGIWRILFYFKCLGNLQLWSGIKSIPDGTSKSHLPQIYILKYSKYCQVIKFCLMHLLFLSLCFFFQFYSLFLILYKYLTLFPFTSFDAANFLPHLLGRKENMSTNPAAKWVRVPLQTRLPWRSIVNIMKRLSRDL